MKYPLVIVGAGGLGKEIACLVNDLPDYELIGFYDDGLPDGQMILGKFPVLGSTQDLTNESKNLSVTLAFGNPEIRKKVWNQLQANQNLNFPTLVHPQSLQMNRDLINLGRGVVLFPLSVLTAEIFIGDNCVIHTGVSVHHDVHIGAHSVIMPGARLVMSEQFKECSLVESNYFKPHSF